MTRFGIGLSSEENDATRLVEIARLADEQGFDRFTISDHFHPWNDTQGESPMVWAVIGAIAGALPEASIGTAVTCPTFRIHPLIVAQAAATAQQLAGGRFFLGVGSGENLNEHVLGQRWPEVDVRHDRLREAVELIRRFWQGGNQSWHGAHYTVENARIYSLPDEPPPIYVSAFGPVATQLAADIGDGFVNVAPDADAVEQYRKDGGAGPAIACPKCCWAPDLESGRRLVHELWPNSGLPGQLAQELATPLLFEQASELVDVGTAVGSVPCGPDPEVHAAALRTYVDAGYDEVYVQQIGPDQETFLRFYRERVLPMVG
jgi:G6PDH family F420-dependent oxidoreductase